MRRASGWAGSRSRWAGMKTPSAPFGSWWRLTTRRSETKQPSRPPSDWPRLRSSMGERLSPRSSTRAHSTPPVFSSSGPHEHARASGWPRPPGTMATRRPALEHGREALEAAVDAGDAMGRADALWFLADVDRLTGDPGRSRSRFEQALAIFDDLEEPHGRARCLYGLAVLSRSADDLDRARGALSRGAQHPEAAGDPARARPLPERPRRGGALSQSIDSGPRLLPTGGRPLPVGRSVD